MSTRPSLPIVVGCVIVAVSGNLLFPLTTLKAENGCPAGYWPAKTPVESWSDCTAIPDYGEPPEDLGEPLEDVGPPAPVWETRWGAIAVGDTSTGGGFSVSTDAKSKCAAEIAAIQECMTNNGGKLCKDKTFSYFNQCVVIAWGERSYVIRSAATVGAASERAIWECSERTADCSIFYSACSLPVRVG